MNSAAPFISRWSCRSKLPSGAVLGRGPLAHGSRPPSRRGPSDDLPNEVQRAAPLPRPQRRVSGPRQRSPHPAGRRATGSSPCLGSHIMPWSERLSSPPHPNRAGGKSSEASRKSGRARPPGTARRRSKRRLRMARRSCTCRANRRRGLGPLAKPPGYCNPRRAVVPLIASSSRPDQPRCLGVAARPDHPVWRATTSRW